MADGDDSIYNNTNRAFLQAFIARSTLTLEEAKPLLASIFTAHERRETLPEDVTETDFNAYIAAANNAISPYDLEIRSTYHQTSRTRVYALVNSTSDPLSQIATPYSVEEIAFLKRVLDAMFETYNTRRHEIMAITSMQAVRLHKPSAENRRETQNASESQGAAAQGISMTQAEKMLKTLVDEGWLEKSRKGFYSLSPRALMELRGWLMETYNDVEDDDEDARTLNIKLCYACKEIITVGQRCPTRACQCRLHDICTQNFFRMQKSKKCPLCTVDWSGNDFVGERAVAKDNRRNGTASVPAVQAPVESDSNEDESE